VRIALAIDHAGVPLRDAVSEAIRAGGHELLDLGCQDDYPDTALDAARAIAAGDADRAILVCGSGAGVSVAANKLAGMRASVCHDHYTAAQSVVHDDCNMLCLGARVIGPAIAAELTDAFCAAQFSGEERHLRRLEKILRMERDGMEASP
jgi:ribose 5-phosphate isomerase B